MIFPFREIIKWFYISSWKQADPPKSTLYLKYSITSKKHTVSLPYFSLNSSQGERKNEGVERERERENRRRKGAVFGRNSLVLRTRHRCFSQWKPVSFQPVGVHGGFNYLSFYTAEWHKWTNCSNPAEKSSAASVSRGCWCAKRGTFHIVYRFIS